VPARKSGEILQATVLLRQSRFQQGFRKSSPRSPKWDQGTFRSCLGEALMLMLYRDMCAWRERSLHRRDTRKRQ
jgi:hypothetical protein